MGATLLLPPLAHLQARLPATMLLALGRGNRTDHPGAGRRAQLLRHFDIVPDGWPIAALQRQADRLVDAGLHATGEPPVDAVEANAASPATRDGQQWLRVDPAYVRADMAGARMLACGDAMALDADDAAAFAPMLHALLDTDGRAFESTSSGWYLCLPVEPALPGFADPGDVLGDDLFDHLPAGAEGRPWRALLSEAQVLLHNHPWNAARAAQGKPPVNALWLSGGGAMPAQVHALHTRTLSDDPAARALGSAAGVVDALPTRFNCIDDDTLIDLACVRDPTRLVDDWLARALDAAGGGPLRALQLDFEDGVVFDLAPLQRLRLWRKPLARMAPGATRDAASADAGPHGT